MNKEGWNYLVNSRREHYFINGKSLCGKFLILGYGDCNETSNNPCSECSKRLARKKTKEANKNAGLPSECDFYGEGCSKCDKRKECIPIENLER